ncbi:MAG: hypothetical protein ACYDCK_03875 [Thermoplasmatota archaeon]
MARERSKSAIVLAVVFAGLVALPAGASLAAVSAPDLPLVKHFMPTLDATKAHPNAGSTDVNNLISHGGPIEKVPKVYLVFWGFRGSDPNSEAPYLAAFFAGVGGTPWTGVQTQYGEGARGLVTNPTNQLAGVWFDDSLNPPPVPDVFIKGEARNAATHFGYDPDATYIIATPHDLNDALFKVQYCAWHSSTPGAQGPIAFTDLPYIPDAGGSCGANFVNGGTAGALDGVSIVAGHEYAEAVTDPQTNAWYDANGQENGDKCAWNAGPGAHAQDIVLSTGTFAVQSLWSNAVSGCAVS